MKLYCQVTDVAICIPSDLLSLNRCSIQMGVDSLTMYIVSYSVRVRIWDRSLPLPWHILLLSLCDIAIEVIVKENNEFINNKASIQSCMPSSQSSSSAPPPPSSSSSSEVEELRTRAVREQVDLYRQLREQLVTEAERYQREGNHKLASIISESLKEP